MFPHGGRTIARLRLAVSAEIGQCKAKARGEGVHDRHPELVVSGKRVQQNYVRTIAVDFVIDGRVIAVDLHGARILDASLGQQKSPLDHATCAPWSGDTSWEKIYA